MNEWSFLEIFFARLQNHIAYFFQMWVPHISSFMCEEMTMDSTSFSENLVHEISCKRAMELFVSYYMAACNHLLNVKVNEASVPCLMYLHL